MSMAYFQWKNLLDYYIECLSSESNQSLEFSTKGQDKRFIVLDNETKGLFTSDEPTHLKLSKKIKQFLHQIHYRGRSDELYASYPFYVKRTGEYKVIQPVFSIKLNFKDDTQNNLAILEKKSDNIDLNLNLFLNLGITLEEALSDHSEITSIFQQQDKNKSTAQIFIEALGRFIKLHDTSDIKFNSFQFTKKSVLEEFKPGVNNGILLYWGEPSAFYKNTITELNELKNKKYYEKLDQTSLKYFFLNEGQHDERDITKPVYNVIALDKFQEKAVQRSLSKGLTAIQGPPGTGKSQVLVNLVINSLINGKSILFASKNNKAVDVVYERIDELIKDSWEMRVGSLDVTEASKKGLIHKLQAKGYKFQEYEEKDRLEQSLVSFQKALEESENLNQKIIFKKRLLDQEQKLQHQIQKIHQKIDALAFKGHIETSCLSRTFFIQIYQIWMKSIQRKQISFFSNSTRTLEYIKDQKKFNDLIELIRIAKEELNEVQENIDGLSSMDELKQEWLQQSLKLYRKKWDQLITQGLYEGLTSTMETYYDGLRFLRRPGPITLKLKMNEKICGLFDRIKKKLPVWGVTNLSVNNSFPLSGGIFDMVVIDEASQCDFASTIPLLFRAKKAVIIGDSMQLPHITSIYKAQDDSIASRNGIDSMYPEFSFRNSLYKIAKLSQQSAVSLRGHYRCHPEIIKFSNDNYYGENLVLHTEDRFKNKKNIGLKWVDIKGKAYRPAKGKVSNLKEAEAVLEIYEQISNQTDEEINFGIISPFREQINLIRKKFNNKYKNEPPQDVLIDVVHKFQGDQRDIIIFSPVVTEGLPKGTVKFVTSEPNLLNVAVTRAKQHLVIAGDYDFAIKTESLDNNDSNLEKLASYAHLLNAVE